MYEEDYIMRKISNLIRFLSIVLTGKERKYYRHSYERLNKMEDEFLEENNFSRDEIKEGLRDLASMLGIDLRLYGG